MQEKRYCFTCGQEIAGEECTFCCPPSLLYWQGGITFVLNWRQDRGRPYSTIARIVRAESKEK